MTQDEAEKALSTMRDKDASVSERLDATRKVIEALFGVPSQPRPQLSDLIKDK